MGNVKTVEYKIGEKQATLESKGAMTDVKQMGQRLFQEFDFDELSDIIKDEENDNIAVTFLELSEHAGKAFPTKSENVDLWIESLDETEFENAARAMVKDLRALKHEI